MNLRLHEIELGTARLQECTAFYQSVLGLGTIIKQESLTVFDSGNAGLELDLSNHFPQGTVCISFITDDLQTMQERLTNAGIPYEGPKPTHLGMSCIQFKDPAGYLIKVNMLQQGDE